MTQVVADEAAGLTTVVASPRQNNGLHVLQAERQLAPLLLRRIAVMAMPPRRSRP